MTNNDAYNRVKDRLLEAGFVFKELPAVGRMLQRLEIQFPNGPQTREVYVTEQNAEYFEQISFEEIILIGDYSSILNPTTGKIECTIDGLNRKSKYALQSIFPYLEQSDEEWMDDDEEEEDKDLPEDYYDGKLVAYDNNNALTIELARSSPSLQRISRDFGRHSVRITGIKIFNHDQALEALAKLTDSYFFSLQLEHSISIRLSRPRRYISRRIRPSYKTPESQPKFPTHEYDKDALSLFWYAQSAEGMPLLEFLALYQVLEYYFPMYANRKAGSRIKAMLKNPTFRVDRDADIARLVSTLANTTKGGLGAERQQLKATIEECTTEEELTDYLTKYPERKSFFSRPHKKLTEKKILSGKPLTANIESASSAIYDIRCKIVHSKMDENNADSSRLLPFSDEADLMHEYTKLLEFLAQKVLINSSSKLEF